MVQLLSMSQMLSRGVRPANGLSRVLAIGAVGLGIVLLLAALILWAHYGSAVFFEVIASGFAACF